MYSKSKAYKSAFTNQYCDVTLRELNKKSIGGKNDHIKRKDAIRRNNAFLT